MVNVINCFHTLPAHVVVHTSGIDIWASCMIRSVKRDTRDCWRKPGRWSISVQASHR
jgi:hypothetical protein